ncbi:MAG: hypothetical protein U0163_13790 [Gemmatimonadaceae bacterium]
MRPTFRLVFAIALCTLASPVSISAQATSRAPRTIGYADASFAVRFGSLGVGVEMSKLIASHLGARVGANYFNYTGTQSQSDISFDATFKAQSFSGLIDLYPSARGAFHLTGGVLTNPLKVDGTGVPTGSTFTVNDVEYTAAQVGTLNAHAKFPAVSPYAGLGWGTPARKNGRVRFVMDLGAAIGKPDVTLDATGAAGNAALASDLQAQQQKIQNDVNKYGKVYPVVQFGLLFKF